MAKGIKKANEYGGIDENEIISLAKLGKTTPTPKGFDQVAGEGTVPTNLEIDKQILKDFIHDFATLNKDHQFAEHPFFGNMERNRWVVLASYHLNHHLKQFGV